MKEKNTNAISEISTETIAHLNNTLTKSQKNILLALHYNSNVCQSELAEILDTKVNSLSNLLTKLKSISPSLLQEDKRGKYKYFMLTSAGEKYVKNLQKTPNSFFVYRISQNQALIHQAIDYLKDLAGMSDAWELDFILFLSGQEKNFPSEAVEAYDGFIQLMYELRKEAQSSFESFLADNIENSALNAQLRLFVETNLKDYFILEPLFSLAKSNEYGASIVIDTITSESNLNTSASIPSSEYLEYISEDDYCIIFRAVMKMITEAAKKNRTKKQAYNHWLEQYHTSSPVLLQIAEKYANINNSQKKNYM